MIEYFSTWVVRTREADAMMEELIIFQWSKYMYVCIYLSTRIALRVEHVHTVLLYLQRRGGVRIKLKEA